jgi:hypothetical protein
LPQTSRDLQRELARILTSRPSGIRAPKLIFDDPPNGWRDLQEKVRQIFSECGCEAATEQPVTTVRGKVNVDVVVQDKTRRPHGLIFCECKLWKRKVPKTVVHAFRTVVSDAGANLGYIISDRGFQSGSREAAKNANIRLLTWKQFQAELFERWFATMEARLTRYCDQISALEETSEQGGETLADFALRHGGEEASQLFDLLQRVYVQFSFASTEQGAGKFRRFPFGSIDPSSLEDGPQVIEFRSPRMYFDIMFDAAPRAFRDYAVFLTRYTNGMCGKRELFEAAIVKQIRVRKSSQNDVRKLLGLGSVKVIPTGEILYYWGSATEFRLPKESEKNSSIGSARTLTRTFELEFSGDGKLQRMNRKSRIRDGL